MAFLPIPSSGGPTSASFSRSSACRAGDALRRVAKDAKDQQWIFGREMVSCLIRYLATRSKAFFMRALLLCLALWCATAAAADCPIDPKAFQSEVLAMLKQEFPSRTSKAGNSL